MDFVMVKRVLMVAFHFPPVIGSSGVQRTLKFSKYLLEHGWEPTVLTVSPWAYRKTRSDQMTEIPKSVRVVRSWAFDASRHMAIRGKYPAMFARPDPWRSWWFSAVPIGLTLARYLKIDLLWSTYPFPTAHMIAGTIHRYSHIPWVADFRDMMVEDNYPHDLRVRSSYRRVEESTISRASRVVMTSPGTKEFYSSRYAREDKKKWVIIRNGYDEENFGEAQAVANTDRSGPIKIVHSGLLYPSERDPSHFFKAVAQLRDDSFLDASRLQVTLRATGHDEYHANLINKYDIGDLVRIEAGIAYSDALAEMLSADGLLIFQAENCNHQIPAKLYEYFRAGRPILALTDPAGDTAKTMYEAGLSSIARLDSTESIKAGLMEFVQDIERDAAPTIGTDFVSKYSRRAQSAELARLFDDVVAEH